MIIGMRGHDFGRMEPEALAKAIADSGFRATQLAFTKAFPSPAQTYMTKEQLEQIRDAFAARGIRLPVMGCYVSAGDPDDVIRNDAKERFAACLRASVVLGAGCVGTETTHFTFEESERETAYAHLLDFMRAVVPAAEECGAVVGVEPVACHTLCSPEMTRRLLDDIKSDSVKIILDMANLLTKETCSPAAQMDILKRCLALFGDKICVLHVKDGVFGEDGKWIEKPMGEGVMDWQTLLPVLKAHDDSLCVLREGVWPGREEEECRLICRWAGEGFPQESDPPAAVNGIITTHPEFLYPDTPLDRPLPSVIRAACAQNGSVGVQILFETEQASGSVRVVATGADVKMYQMIDVPVEYNTGDGVSQGGAMVVLPEERPSYATRKAPFRVYDCLRPTDGRSIPEKNGRIGVYVVVQPSLDVCDGFEVLLEIGDGERYHRCVLTCEVYPVCADENLFKTTNWFSVAAMEKMHGVTRGTPAFYDVVRAYARSMRGMHQKIFLLWLHEDLSERRVQKPYQFDFEDMKPIIEIFFEEGFDTLETGGILCRGYREDGSVDMYTADLKCSADPSVSVDSHEGYTLLCAEMRAFADFLKRNGWQDKVIFHVIDEPDVHYRSEDDLNARRLQFFLAANIVRRYLPDAKIIEAVKTTLLRGAVDIMVPITDGYQNNRAAFDEMIDAGEEVFTYVCCAPTGKWLNRFLDQPLLNGRLIFWGCAASRIGGYLHWGFNQFSGVPDPFEATSAKNWTGIGTNFPCGDAFIVYPGKDGPWPSMRYEAARMGAQDAALLRALREKDKPAHDALISRVFTAFDDYCGCPDTFAQVHEELLRLLSR